MLSLQAEERLALSFYLAAHLPDCYDIYENVQFYLVASDAGMIFISTIFIALLHRTLQRETMDGFRE